MTLHFTKLNCSSSNSRKTSSLKSNPILLITNQKVGRIYFRFKLKSNQKYNHILHIEILKHAKCQISTIRNISNSSTSLSSSNSQIATLSVGHIVVNLFDVSVVVANSHLSCVSKVAMGNHCYSARRGGDCTC